MKKLVLILASLVMITTTAYSETTKTGIASYYSIRCNGGTHTASGQRLIDSSNTAAHKTLPFGTIVKVTNLKNGKSQIVTINNRGPYIKGRIIDVTIGVSEKLGFKKQGLTKVKLEVVKLGKTINKRTRR